MQSGGRGERLFLHVCVPDTPRPNNATPSSIRMMIPPTPEVVDSATGPGCVQIEMPVL